MTQSATPATDREASVGRLNYLDSSVPSSLYRNGKMLLRRNADGSDSELEGVVFDDASTPPNAPARWSIEVRCVVIYH